MAKVRLTFSMQGPPDQAQSRFVDDIAPELHRKAEFSLCRQVPGRLEFAFVETPGIFVARDSPLVPRRMIGGPHITVKFKSDLLGTKVTIRGHCERDVCNALELLGRPGHWPETAQAP